MKAEELMRNDWVCIDNENTPRQVDWIRSGEVGLLWGQTVTPPYLNPISITPEILLKNRFNKLSDVLYVFYNTEGNGYVKIRLCDLKDGEWELLVDNYDRFDDSHITFSNDRCFLKVHELQHALRLCRIEKEIEL